jgi:hypothetical protein
MFYLYLCKFLCRGRGTFLVCTSAVQGTLCLVCTGAAGPGTFLGCTNRPGLGYIIYGLYRGTFFVCSVIHIFLGLYRGRGTFVIFSGETFLFVPELK